MSALAVPALSIGVALGAGGLAKLRQPRAASPLLRAARLPAGPVAGVALGAAELALAVATVLVGGPVLHGLVAATFAAFAAVLVVVLRGGGAESCGCFGARSAPPHGVHVGVDVAAAGIAALAALAGTPGVATGLLDGTGGEAIAVLALAALGGALVVACLTVLPDALTTGARRTASTTPEPFHLIPPEPS